jgi:glycerol-3-phosphate acyltransferase PlsY
MNPILTIFITTLIAYLLGSIPMGVLVARIFGWPDPRSHGSGHTGGLNSLRGGGLPAGVFVALLDLGKGAFALWLAGRLAAQLDPVPQLVSVAVAGAAAVAGHCWSVWIGFKGGMGLSTGAGAVATHVLYPPFIAAAAWGFFLLVIRHKARATMAAALTVPLGLWLLNADPETFWLGVSITIVLLIRHMADWNRVYD